MRKNKELLKSRNQEEREKQLNLREQKTTRRPKEKQGDGKDCDLQLLLTLFRSIRSLRAI